MQEKLKDFIWSFSEFDRLIDIILSNLGTLKEELTGKDPEKEKIVGKYYDIFNFKIETLYSLLIKLEDLIFSTTFAYYRKYHSSVRGELSLVEFESVKREVSYIFDSFLTQYKSLLDLAVKFAFSYTSTGQKLPWKIDSFGRLLILIDKRDKPNYQQTYAILEKMMSPFIENRGALEDIAMYRDYIIHHGYVKHQLVAKSTEGHVFFSYLIPLLIRTRKYSYDVDPNKTLRIDHFCREKFHILLSSIAKLTDLLYDDRFKHPYIEKLGTFAPELVKDVLLRISRKELWADRVLFEEEFKAFLRSKGIDFSELVQDFVHTQREPGDKVSMIIERTYYKPIGDIKVFRTIFILEGVEQARNEFKPSYGIITTGASFSDFISQKPKFGEILDTLRKSGLVYVIKTKEGTRYASVRDDLKSLVVTLDELSRFKWSFIQIPEMKYFRPRTQEETEISRKILGSGAEEYLRKEDEERERVLKEYEEWKKQPEHYFENSLDILDKDGKVIARITHKEFVEEEKRGFQNWRQNKRITLIEKDGKTESLIVPFFIDKDIDQEWLQKLIETCEKQWVGQPEHFLEFQKELIEESKRKYEANVKTIKEEFAPILKKYEYLKPVFRLLNQDVFA